MASSVDAHGGVKVGNWIVLLAAAIAVWVIWMWFSKQSWGTLSVQPANFGPSGTYTYGPTGLTAWSALPTGPLQPTPLPSTYQLPNFPNPMKGTFFGPILGPSGTWNSNSSGNTDTGPVGGPAPDPTRAY